METGATTKSLLVAKDQVTKECLAKTENDATKEQLLKTKSDATESITSAAVDKANKNFYATKNCSVNNHRFVKNEGTVESNSTECGGTRDLEQPGSKELKIPNLTASDGWYEINADRKPRFIARTGKEVCIFQ